MRLDLCSKKKSSRSEKRWTNFEVDVDVQGTTVGAALVSRGHHVCHSRELVWGVGLQLLDVCGLASRCCAHGPRLVSTHLLSYVPYPLSFLFLPSFFHRIPIHHHVSHLVRISQPGSSI